MLLEKIKRKNGRFLGKFECDTCHDVFIKALTRCSSSHGQFCSRKCSSSCEAVIEQKRQSCVATYGASTAMQTQDVRDKAKRTFKERYGVTNPFQSKEIMGRIDKQAMLRKIHETMKRNGTYARQQSKTEDLCYEVLCELFGNDDVERHVPVSTWDIDLYVRSIDAYVQVDGVYWHGLDRPIDVIQEFRSPRDKVIYSTVIRDKEREDWFKTNGKRLVRFTDRELKRWQKEKSLEIQVKTRLTS